MAMVRGCWVLRQSLFSDSSDHHCVCQVHGDYSDEVGAKIERPVGDDAEPTAEAVPVLGA